MELKKEIANNLIAEVELNEYQSLFDNWGKLKKDLIFDSNSILTEEHFWNNIKYISEEIGNKIRNK